MRTTGAITLLTSTRRHREMKLGFVIQAAVALYLLLSPAQVGNGATFTGALKVGDVCTDFTLYSLDLKTEEMMQLTNDD